MPDRRRHLPQSKYWLTENFGGSVIDVARWTVTDAESKLSVAAGVLSCAGGKAAPAWDDPMLSGRVGYTVRAGLTWQAKVRFSAWGDTGAQAGWDGTTPVANALAPSFRQYSTGLWLRNTADNATIQLPTTIALTTDYLLRIVLTNPGAIWYYSDDNGASWKILWVDTAGATGTIYQGISNNDAAFTVEAVHVFQGAPRAAALSGTVSITPSLGAELDSGNLVVGNWYSITATQVNYFFTGCAIGNTFRATATTALDANNKVKLITTASMLALVSNLGTRNGLMDSAPTLTAGTQAGHAVSVDDEASPTYGLFAYHDGTNAKLDKLDAGTWTNLVSAAATYSAGASVRSVINGTSIALYYNDALIGAIQTVANIASYGTRVCGFSTLATNSAGTITARRGINV